MNLCLNSVGSLAARHGPALLAARIHKKSIHLFPSEDVKSFVLNGNATEIPLVTLQAQGCVNFTADCIMRVPVTAQAQYQ